MTLLHHESDKRTAPEQPRSFVSEVNSHLERLDPRLLDVLGPHAFTQSLEAGLITFTPTAATKGLVEKIGQERYRQAVELAGRKMDWGQLNQIDPDGTIRFSFRVSPVRKR